MRRQARVEGARRTMAMAIMIRLRVRYVTAVAALMSMVMEAMVKMAYCKRLASWANTG